MRTAFRAILGIVVCLSVVSCGRKGEDSTEARGETSRAPKGTPKRESSTEAGKELVNSIGMKFRLIQPGFFMMGSDKGDSNEQPVHKVTLTKAFHMGVYEVTQEEWERVMGTNPSQFKGPKSPVENVSWDDAREFASKLSQKEKVTYRLPTEAEWEYACRAGTTTEYYWGDDADKREAGDYAWWGKNSGGATHPVGRKKPNAWGLYDMSGNVCEWCVDWISTRYPGEEAVDPNNVSAWNSRVFRGGAWGHDASFCRSAARGGISMFPRYNFVGFRLVRTSEQSLPSVSRPPK